MSVGLTAISFVVDRKAGHLDRSRVAGVTNFEIMIAHVITHFIVICVQVFFLLMFIFLVFQIPNRGSYVLVVFITLLQGAAGMSYGLIISAICFQESTAIMLALGSFYPNMLLSGVVWPTQAMPLFMKYISTFLPQTLAVESLRSILLRGWGITHYQVWIGFVSTLCWLVGFLLIASLLFKRVN